jgi:hypothetical protein
MLNTYIKNQGITQTIVHDKNRNHFNEVNWDADYDGNTANISVKSNVDGKRDKFDISLDNEDLANILNIPSVNMPIHKRLKIDFQEPFNKREQQYLLELPPSPRILSPRILTPRILTPEFEPRKPEILEEIINSGITSPATGEEFIVPLTIDKKTIDDYILTPRKRHRRRKTHITHKIYKKPKSSTKSKNTKSKSKTRSSRK